MLGAILNLSRRLTEPKETPTEFLAHKSLEQKVESLFVLLGAQKINSDSEKPHADSIPDSIVPASLTRTRKFTERERGELIAIVKEQFLLIQNKRTLIEAAKALGLQSLDDIRNDKFFITLPNSKFSFNGLEDKILSIFHEFYRILCAIKEEIDIRNAEHDAALGQLPPVSPN